jgi:two-component system OmpR family response regulator
MEPKDIRVLLADDNPDILKIMTIFLEREGYTAVGVSNGIDALVALREQEFHLIILDIMMPGLTGIETCRRVREYTHAPILFVTAKSKEQAQLSAYESGGDDYLTKPFSKEEFLVRVRALLRRYVVYQKNDYKEDDKNTPICLPQAQLEIDGDRVYKAGVAVELTSKELGILKYLVRHRGETVHSQELYEAVWNEQYLPSSSNTIMVHIMKLRKKVEDDPNRPTLIQTIWGRGYQIDR